MNNATRTAFLVHLEQTGHEMTEKMMQYDPFCLPGHQNDFEEDCGKQVTTALGMLAVAEEISAEQLIQIQQSVHDMADRSPNPSLKALALTLPPSVRDLTFA